MVKSSWGRSDYMASAQTSSLGGILMPPKSLGSGLADLESILGAPPFHSEAFTTKNFSGCCFNVYKLGTIRPLHRAVSSYS